MPSENSKQLVTKLKKKNFKVKHQNKKYLKPDEPFLSVFIWGINHTINELMNVRKQPILLPNDFKACYKIEGDNHLFNKNNLPGHFKVKEYCPMVFKDIRRRFKIEDFDYKESLTRDQPIPDDLITTSGATFYQSSDKYFIIKTITSYKLNKFRSFLKFYYPHIVERHGKTLLPKYLGMYRLTVDNSKYYVIVIKNDTNHLSAFRKFNMKYFAENMKAVDVQRYVDEDLFKIVTADMEFLTKLRLI